MRAAWLLVAPSVLLLSACTRTSTDELGELEDEIRDLRQDVRDLRDEVRAAHGRATRGDAPQPATAAEPTPEPTPTEAAPAAPVAPVAPAAPAAPAAASPAAPAPAAVTVMISSVPAGAAVYIADKLTGRTPMTLETPPDSGELTIRLELDGYRAHVTSIRPAATPSLSVRLARLGGKARPSRNDVVNPFRPE